MALGTASIKRQRKPKRYWADPETPEFYPEYRIKIVRPDGKETLVTSGTCDRARASRKAARIKKEIREGRWDFVSEKISGGFPTIGKLVDTYLEEPVICKTAKASANALLNMVRTVHGGSPRSQCSSILNDNFVLEYLRIRQGGVLDVVTRKHENSSINHHVSNARVVFSKRARYYKFRDVKLPDSIEGFLGAPLLKVTQTEWQPIPDAEYLAMDEASRALPSFETVSVGGKKVDARELWLVNQVLRRTGIRACELVAARDSWLESDGGTRFLVVKDRPEEGFQLKGFRSRKIPLDSDLAEILAGRQGWLINATSNTARANLVYRIHNRWLKEFISGTFQGNHLLRKHIGSVIYTKHGAEAAADYLGHVNIQTTRNHYQARLETLPTVTEEDIQVANKITKTQPAA